MIVTLAVLTFLILLHEVGHFLAARLFKVRVDEFGFGLPPKMITLGKRGETEFTLNWLPIGGFVRLFGEDGDLKLFDKLNPLVQHRSFLGKPSWHRFIILFAGIAMNLLIGIAIFSTLYSISGVPILEGSRAVIADVAKGSPAELSGMKMEQAVITVNGQEVHNSTEFVEIVNQRKGENVTIQVGKLTADGTLSENREMINVIPRINPPEGQGSLGVTIATIPIVSYEKKPWYLAPFYGAKNGILESYAWGREILRNIPVLLGSLVKGKIPEGTSGPIGVVKQGARIYEESGISGSLRFGAILSINLAIFNLLPIPGLDGGRILFLGLEKIVGRKRVNKYENQINMGGILLLITFLLVITWKDIWG